MFKIFNTDSESNSFNRKSSCAIPNCPICSSEAEDNYIPKPYRVADLTEQPKVEDWFRQYKLGLIARDLTEERKKEIQETARDIVKNAIATQFPTRESQKGKFNIGGLTFRDISSEEWREYYFTDGSFLRIEYPVGLNISENGHRIFNEAGESFYVSKDDFTYIKWRAKKGQPPFVF